nr:hypothetical protein GCM10020093_094030 [Planobispora longispora]
MTAATVASQDIVASLPGLARYLQVFVLVPLAVVAVLRDRVDLWLVGGAVCGTALIQGRSDPGRRSPGTAPRTRARASGPSGPSGRPA